MATVFKTNYRNIRAVLKSGRHAAETISFEFFEKFFSHFELGTPGDDPATQSGGDVNPVYGQLYEIIGINKVKAIPYPGYGTEDLYNGRSLMTGVSQYIWVGKKSIHHYRMEKMGNYDVPYEIRYPKNEGNNHYTPSGSHLQTAYEVGYNLAYSNLGFIAYILSLGGTPGMGELGDTYTYHMRRGMRMGEFDKKWGFENWFNQ